MRAIPLSPEVKYCGTPAVYPQVPCERLSMPRAAPAEWWLFGPFSIFICIEKERKARILSLPALPPLVKKAQFLLFLLKFLCKNVISLLKMV
ncbi:MAG: hypothetical protein MSC43_07715 [Clostridiales bacterium]|nr:hypothetical protein [Clostridiales bacterium]MDD7431788.1 hypothetical protein [Clostridiales bacterium]MDY3062357.1 hypothetical protein [Eubacteriales bacterium]